MIAQMILKIKNFKRSLSYIYAEDIIMFILTKLLHNNKKIAFYVILNRSPISSGRFQNFTTQ